MDFSQDYLVHYYEADQARRLTLSALVQYFEDIAILHSTNAGYDLEYYDANHCGWMLLKWDVSIHSLPTFGQRVTVDTRVHAMKRFLSDREFVMTADDGTVLAEGRSNWLLVDTDKRRPLRVSEDQCRAFNVSAASEADFVSIEDVPPVTEAEAESAIAGQTEVVRRPVLAGNTDIDTNRHVNNVSYLDWALDSLPSDFVSRHTPSRLIVQYRKELVLGASAEVLTFVEASAPGASATDASTTRSTVRSGGEDCCSLLIEWN